MAAHLLIVGCQERYRLAHGKCVIVVEPLRGNSSKRKTFIVTDPYADQSTLARDVCKPLPSVLLSQGASTYWDCGVS